MPMLLERRRNTPTSNSNSSAGPEMAKASGGGRRKERIRPPTKRELTDASAQLRAGHPSGARTMADKSVAVRQGVTKRTKKR